MKPLSMLNRNVTLIYQLRFLMGLTMGVFFSVSALFYSAFGLGRSDIAEISQWLMVAFLFAEVPSGIIADRIGRSRTLFWAGACLVATFATMTVLAVEEALHPYAKTIFIATEFMLALGVSLATGTDQALLWESLAPDCRDNLFTKLYSRARLGEYIAMGVGGLCSGLLLSISPTLTPLVALCCIALYTLRTYRLQEPSPVKPTVESSTVGERCAATLRDTLQAMVRLRWSWMLVVLFGGIYSFSPVFRNFFQLIAKHSDVSSEQVGFIFGVGYIVAALAGLFAHRIESRLGEIGSLCLIVMVIVASFFSLGLGQLVPFAPLLIVFLANDLFANIVLLKYINRESPAEIRATMTSIGALLSRASSWVILLFYRSPPGERPPLDELRDAFFSAGVFAAVLLCGLIAIRQLTKSRPIDSSIVTS